MHILDPQSEIMMDHETISIKQEMQCKYPVMYKRLENIASANLGKIPVFVKEFYGKVIDFCMNFF